MENCAIKDIIESHEAPPLPPEDGVDSIEEI